jgi:hypothetical protein
VVHLHQPNRPCAAQLAKRDTAGVSWFDTRVGRLVSALVGLFLLILDWPNGTINPLAGPVVLAAIPRSPIVRGHVFLVCLMLVGLYGVGVGIWLGKLETVLLGGVLAVFSAASEVAFCLTTRARNRLPDHVAAAIARQRPQFSPRYNFRLANGEVAYWPVTGGAYLPRRYRRYRRDFGPENVVDVEPGAPEPVW